MVLWQQQVWLTRLTTLTTPCDEPGYSGALCCPLPNPRVAIVVTGLRWDLLRSEVLSVGSLFHRLPADSESQIRERERGRQRRERKRRAKGAGGRQGYGRPRE